MGLTNHGKRIPDMGTENALAIRHYDHWEFGEHFELEVVFKANGQIQITDDLGQGWNERYFMMKLWFNQYYPEIVDDLINDPIKGFPMEWPADMLAPAAGKDDEPGMILCDKHGYYWSEDGCIACANGD